MAKKKVEEVKKEKTAAGEKITATVTGGRLNIRSERTTDSEILGVLADGTQVETVKRGRTWCELSSGGYVMAKFLKF